MPLHYPQPQDLKTGDLLFPRVPAPVAKPADDALDAWTGQPLRKLLGVNAVQMLYDRRFRPDVSGLLEPQGLRPKGKKQDPEQARIKLAGRELLVLLILVRTSRVVRDLLGDWLDMSVGEFLRHPLRKILFGALAPGGESHLFVGHVAMVLRERDGAHADKGDVWVIEANTTDFSHYGVALHRYWAEREPTGRIEPGAHGYNRMRGWANRRLAQGDAIWHSRLAPACADDRRTLEWRQSLVNQAKRYLGTPFGFFDDPEFGSASRLYCGEFIQKVFADVEPDQAWQVGQNRSWDWLLTHLDVLGPPEFVNDVMNALTADLRESVQGQPFFLLTLPMLYRSAQLRHIGPNDYA